jgi:transcriptional regulator NrdR family protein
MSQQSMFLCPECESAGAVFTPKTHPHTYSSQMDRERKCNRCGGEFETIETVLRVTKRGRPEAIEAAARERARNRDLLQWADEVNSEIQVQRRSDSIYAD